MPFLYAHHTIITQSTIIILVQLQWVSVYEQSAQLTWLNLTDSKKFPITHREWVQHRRFKIKFFFSQSHTLNFTLFRLHESVWQKYRDLTTHTSGIHYFELFSFFWVAMDHKALILCLLSWLRKLILSTDEKVDMWTETQEQSQQRSMLKCCAVLSQSLSHVCLFATSYTVAHKAPLSCGFSRQEYWSGLPCPFPGDLPCPGIKPRSPSLQGDSLLSEPPGELKYQVKHLKYHVPNISMTFVCDFRHPSYSWCSKCYLVNSNVSSRKPQVEGHSEQGVSAQTHREVTDWLGGKRKTAQIPCVLNHSL